MCGAVIPEQDKRANQHDLCLACKGARIPAHCPYKAGDRVVMPGSPNARRYHPDDPMRTGFRGVVEGTCGARLLLGLRDDGREWCQSWGALEREKLRCRYCGKTVRSLAADCPVSPTFRHEVLALAEASLNMRGVPVDPSQATR
jgi:hypothetical protein